MNKLDRLIPKIKTNLKQFDKPRVLFVRPGFCFENGWPTDEEAIVVVTSPTARNIKLPSQIRGSSVEVRHASDIEKFSHAKPEEFSQLADHRAELRGSALPDFVSSWASVHPKIAAKVAAPPYADPL